MSKGTSSNALPAEISNNGAYRQAICQTNPPRPATAAYSLLLYFSPPYSFSIYSFHGHKSNLKMAKFFLFSGKTAFM